MSEDCFILTINPDGTPDRMVGPTTWENAVEHASKIAKRKKNRGLTADEIDSLNCYDTISFADGSSIHIISPEEP